MARDTPRSTEVPIAQPKNATKRLRKREEAILLTLGLLCTVYLEEESEVVGLLDILGHAIL